MRKTGVILVMMLSLQACKPNIDLFDFPPYQTNKRHLAVLLTAVWSEWSGEAGLPQFYSTVQDSFPNKLVPIVAHASTVGDPLYSLAASQFYNLYNADVYPTLGLNTQGFAFRPDAWREAIVLADFDSLNGSLVPAKALLALAVSKRIDSRNLRFKVRARVQETFNTGAPFHLAVYITENNVEAVQSFETRDPQILLHQYVLRGAATPGAWGVPIGTGTYAKDEVLEYEGSFPINPSMNASNLFVCAVAYTLANNQPYKVLNAYLR